jgi:hypothetical protein
VTIQKKLETMEEQIAALIHRRIPVADQANFSFSVKEKTIDIDMPEETFYLEGIQVAKRGIMVDVQKFFPKITTVKFCEIFKAEPKKEEPKTQAEAEP